MSWSTPDLCDASAEVRCPCVPWRNFGGRSQFRGRALTVLCYEDNSRVKEAVQEPGDGRVLVVDGGGSLRHALLGDQLADRAAGNGWAGLVIYGAVRDVDDLARIDLGIKALGQCPRRSERRGQGVVGVPVTIGGATIEPGAHVYADNNGVVVSERALVP